MTDYRRLTEKNINDAEFCNECSYNDDFNGCEAGGCDKYLLYFNVYERLRKLEDMIENGELCDREEGVCKAHESYFDLVDENTTLRRAIEIYCTTYNDIRYFDFDVAIRKAKEEIGKKNKEEKESDL